MCFIKRISLTNCLKGEPNEITEVLNGNVIVYKMVIKRIMLFSFYFAPYYNYEYKKKKVNTSPLQIGFRKGDEYIDIVVEKGFHSFRTLKDLKKSTLWSSKYAIAKFIIPKGSTVIINDTQIVSDKIIFYKEINSHND